MFAIIIERRPRVKIFHLIAYTIARHIAIFIMSDIINQTFIFLTSYFVKFHSLHNYLYPAMYCFSLSRKAPRFLT